MWGKISFFKFKKNHSFVSKICSALAYQRILLTEEIEECVSFIIENEPYFNLLGKKVI